MMTSKDLIGSRKKGDEPSAPPGFNISVENSLPKGVIRGCPSCSNCQKVIACWRSEEGCRPPSVVYTTVFHPTEEEFKDIYKYIEKIRPKAEVNGICRINPPESWKPPFLIKGNKFDTTKFGTHVQEINALKDLHSKRKLNEIIEQKDGSDGFEFESGPEFTLPAFKRDREPDQNEAYSKTTDIEKLQKSFKQRPWILNDELTNLEKPDTQHLNPGNKFDTTKFGTHVQEINALKDLHSKRKLNEIIEQKDGSDGFEFESGPEFTLPAFKRYAEQFKQNYFKKPDMFTGVRTPPWESVEGEYWRIIQNPTEEIQVLSGNNLEAKVLGSGFPLPTPDDHNDNQSKYRKSGWNLNNTPKMPGSLLAFDCDNSTLLTLNPFYLNYGISLF
nr:putative lysine-specific demethylase JMJ16 [Tanacetum cinerariifolium]